MEKKNLDAARHSAAHLLAAAILRLWPDTKLGIGPATQDGFYYDFEFSKTISEANLPRIEQEMTKLKKSNLQFLHYTISVDEAIKKEKKRQQPYKIELIEELKNEGEKKISYYKLGDFDDLCAGPHVKTTSEIGEFKLTRIAGAYWRGDEKNTMLTRIYGTVWSSKEELTRYLQALDEAKQADHRKIGKALDLFTFSDEIGPGLVLWLPKGTVIREELEKFAKEAEDTYGYLRIATPHITRESLYKLSGHLPYYADDMFPPMQAEDGNYYIKPMNCPHTHMVYKAKKHSYRELPIRYAEFGTVYRYEKSGELFGLMRARGLTQNDGHIYCTEEQVVDEVIKVMKLHDYYYKTLGINDYYIELALPDTKDTKGKYFDDPEGWKNAVKILREAAKQARINYVEKKGEAAFYGPKFDFNIKSVIGREFGASTNQLDFGSGKRFDLTYTDRDGKEKIVPYIIHRAPLGSHERFVGFLIEHFKGAFPVWLSPIQVRILPITDKNENYAKEIYNTFKEAKIRVETDLRNETLDAKIREAQTQKIPYLVIVGDREENSKTISIRRRDGKTKHGLKLNAFKTKIIESIEQKSTDLID